MESMDTQILILAVAFLLDLIFKDPAWLYHPVQAVGALASALEKTLRRIFKNKLKIAGAFFLLIQIFFWPIVAIVLARLFYSISPALEFLFWIYLTYSLLAFGSLIGEVSKVKKFLDNGESEQARKIAQGMVSRDLSDASEREIIRATIETATENISDGIIAPMFYFVLGGPLLMLVYKVLNTLDSMVGYRNQKYTDFGGASARFDDLLNFIPSRITGLLIVASAFLLGDSPRGAWRAWMRDGQKGPSPNGGIPITAFAGARDIALGGPCVVDGKIIDIPFVGGDKKDFGIEEIGVVLKYIKLVSTIALILSCGIMVLS